MESPDLHSLRFVTRTCICVLFLLRQWKYCPKQIHLFLFHFLIRVHSTNTLSSPMNRDGLKGKATVGCPIFPFYSVIFGISSSLIWRRHVSKKGYYCFERERESVNVSGGEGQREKKTPRGAGSSIGTDTRSQDPGTVT